MSAEQRAAEEKRQAEEEEHRRLMQADDSKQRALKDMMNAKLVFKKKDADADDFLVGLLGVEERGRALSASGSYLYARTYMHIAS